MGDVKKGVILVSFCLIILIAITSFVFSSDPDSCPDDDNDKVCNIDDLCPNSLPREQIDRDGCDPFQFCRKYYCNQKCIQADFLDNEHNKTFPNDCTLVMIANEGTLEPRCTPVECHKNPQLPNKTIQVKVKINDPISYFNTTLFHIPENYTVTNGTYLGWCVDEDHFIVPGTIYNASLYSSLDPDLAIKCPYCADEDWDKVNYIINHKKGTSEDIQDAIWFFINGGTYPTSTLAIEMINEADMYGRGFWPQEGQFIAVIIDISNRTQLSIIEVDP